MDLRLGQHEALHRLLGREAVAHLLGVDVGFGAEDAEAELLLRHFEREEPDRLAPANRDVLGDVQREGGLADRRPGREDDEVRSLEPGGHPVELGEARRQAREHALPAAGFLDDLEVAADDLPDRLETALDRALGDVEDLAGGLAEQRLRVLVSREPLADDPLARADQPAQRRLFLDDARVMLDVADVGHAVEERREVGGAADLFDRARAVELVLERQHVDLGRALGELAHGGVDAPMVVREEVVGVEDRDDEVERRRIEQDGSENGALRFQVRRQRFVGQ